jgi:hypothetical protein
MNVLADNGAEVYQSDRVHRLDVSRGTFPCGFLTEKKFLKFAAYIGENLIVEKSDEIHADYPLMYICLHRGFIACE